MKIRKILGVISITVFLFFIVACNQNIQFTIYFDSNEGTTVSPITTDGKSTITIPNDPTKDGFEFGGWYWDNNTFNRPFTANSLLIAPISSNMTVYAKWKLIKVTPTTYEVRFVSNGGTYVSPMEVIDNTLMTYPQCSRTGYTLEGWYTSNDNGVTFDSKWNFFSDRIGTDMTLYAKWIINSYTISFNSNLGSSVTQITKDFNTSVSQPVDPIREGYMFGGWYRDAEFTQSFTFETMPAQNITLYAKWVPNLYEVTYHTVYEGSLYQISMSDDELIVKTELGSNFGVILTNQGRVFTWGKNTSGELGIGSTRDTYVTDITARFELEESDYIIDVSVGSFHVLALSNLGNIYVWGSNSYGNLGDGTTTSSKIPLNISSQFNLNSDTRIISIYTGLGSSAALTSDHQLWVWGRNDSGQLGIGTTNNQLTPMNITDSIQLNNDEYINQVSLGWNHSGLVTSQSRVWMWGDNSSGQLGNETKLDSLIPIEVTDYFVLDEGDTIEKIFLGKNTSSAITLTHEVFTWGSTHQIKLGLTFQEYYGIYSILKPHRVTQNFNFDEGEYAETISMGYEHTLVLSNLGRVYGMGNDTWGSLGGSNSYLPKNISKLLGFDDLNIIMIESNWYSSVMVSAEGNIYLLGSYYDHLGTGYDYIGAKSTKTLYMFNQVIEVKTKLVYYGELIDLSYLNLEGYTFDGWYTSNSYNLFISYSEMPSRNIIIYGIYKTN
ncbi:RCC1 domain-containing protein [Haploplasma axanthum]|uniref:Internalin-A n=1 Tax=Haploplasma axanthum TaxID=29552 RepID=A0A449BF75_HAPAX|nr:InlB B-repeat-containing protein [Haploplasma axanthum]VEU81099.1 Internalin-A precursor [Haploplasma axanthum]